MCKEVIPVARFDGRRVKAIREKLGLSQRALAEMIGVDQSTLSHWENNRRRLDSDEVGILADALGVAVDALYDSQPEVDHALLALWQRIPPERKDLAYKALQVFAANFRFPDEEVALLPAAS